MLNQLTKNLFLTAAASSLLTVAPVSAASNSLSVKPAESPANNSLVQNTGANEYFQQGFNLAVQDDKTGAETAFRRAIQIDPNFAEAYANLGSLLANQNKLADAISNLQTAIRLKPNSPEFHYMFGQVLYAQNKMSEALESVKKARDLFRSQGKSQEANSLEQVIRNMTK
ncbi:tetratricopeptide repeat protein [Microcoleus sp. herbarium12]|jgi:tetratricopeptide (TPR) repeat protein|uniref:tetratricopeptide repeat protein n=1 Tax=Microcoleus sp. herbarium12 TaxID=3055437 RepID=UPI002FD2E88B